MTQGSGENILFRKRDEKAFLTINRPNVLNALNSVTIGDIRSTLLRCMDDPEIRVVILTEVVKKPSLQELTFRS